MQAQAAKLQKQYRVWVQGWRNSRTVIEKPGKVAMEITLECSHCATCSARVRHVTETLNSRNIPHAWIYPRGSVSYVEISAPPDGTSVKEHLAHALGLSIH